MASTRKRRKREGRVRMWLRLVTVEWRSLIQKRRVLWDRVILSSHLGIITNL